MDKEDVIIQGGLYTRVIIEIVGGPKEHIEETMKLLVKKLKEKHDVKKNEIIPAEKKEEWWSTFSESEILFKKLDDVIDFIYEFMPSSIEFIEPMKITIENRHLSNVFNALISRLHQTDMLLKEQAAQKQLIIKANNTLVKYSIKQALSSGKKDIPEISKLTGIKEEVLPNFLSVFEKQNLIKEVNGKYELIKAL